MVRDPLRLGCMSIAALKSATSPLPGMPLGFQLPLELKVVLVFFQTLSVAKVDDADVRKTSNSGLRKTRLRRRPPLARRSIRFP